MSGQDHTERPARVAARLLLIAGLAAAALALWCDSGAAAPITEFPADDTTLENPNGIAAGPDGNLWFTDFGDNRIGRITPGGAITEFPGNTTTLSNPRAITPGPEGNLWFTDSGNNKIGRITPGGTITEFPGNTTTLNSPHGITVGADGNIWFADSGNNKIGRITPDGTITEFPGNTTTLSDPEDITAGPDGDLWFTDTINHKIGRITLTGEITEFPGSTTALGDVEQIAAGPDGNIWFTDFGNHKIGRITPAGAITEFPNGAATIGQPRGITAGPDGNLWFTDTSTKRIGRITPAGVITEFADEAAPLGFPAVITAGPDGDLWFTEFEHNKIGRISTELPAPSSGDLLRNPGAELGIPAASGGVTVPVLGWAAMPNFTTLQSGAPGGFPAAPSGGAFFAAGPNDAFSEALQDVDVSSRAGEIDAGRATAILGGQLGGFEGQEDAPSLSARFLDANYNILGSTSIGPVLLAERGGLTGFVTRESTASVPSGTRTIQVIAAGSRSNGEYDDAYFDNLDLELSVAPSASNGVSTGGGKPAGGGSIAGAGLKGGSQVAIAATVGREKLSPSTFPAAPSGPSAVAAKRRVGATVGYTLNEAASVRFTVTQAQAGRRAHGGRCVKPTRTNHRAHKCTRLITLKGSFSRAGATGSNSFRFSGRLAGTKLKPGQYRLVATPSAAGTRGHAASAPFRVIPSLPSL